MEFAFLPRSRSRCPHCATVVQFEGVDLVDAQNVYAELLRGSYATVTGKSNVDPIIARSRCPSCGKAVLEIDRRDGNGPVTIFPRVPKRRALHGSIPIEIKSDYEQAVLVLNDSPMASSALSRRCLQALLVAQGSKSRELVDQIDEIRTGLPGYIQDYVDNIRKLGNIAAHPKKSASTSELLTVETGEAEWMLELLEELFDHFYTKPAEAKVKQDALNKKFAKPTT
jgi:hypothetical protein